jgi:hypothetical protein
MTGVLSMIQTSQRPNQRMRKHRCTLSMDAIVMSDHSSMLVIRSMRTGFGNAVIIRKNGVYKRKRGSELF